MNWLGFSITLVAIGVYKIQRKKKRGNALTPGRRRSSVELGRRTNSEANSRRSFSRFLQGESTANYSNRAMELNRLVVRGEGGMVRANSLELSEVHRFSGEASEDAAL